MSLQKLIVDFCIGAIIENEAEMYGTSAKSNELLAVLTKFEAMEMVSGATFKYVNDTYVSLITRNDSYIIERFEAMCKVADHSVLCILKIIFVVLGNIHLSLNRFLFDTKTYDTYMTCVRLQLSLRRDVLIDKLNQLSIFRHQCVKVDISTCDASKPLFS